MTKVFIGGSRRITRLPADVRRRLDRIVQKGLAVLIGDAHGADKAVQQYLHGNGYERVEVFCTNGTCRNNLGGWTVRSVPASGKRRDFSFYAAKDRAMAEEATVGLMLWDGESVGTLMNVLRLVRRGRTVVVYLAARRGFVDVRGEADWSRLIEACGAGLRARVEREARAEATPAGATTADHTEQRSTQTSLF